MSKVADTAAALQMTSGATPSATRVPKECDVVVKSSILANLKVKSVVGEVPPVYDDALSLRKTVFCGEQKVELSEEIDGLDEISVHLVAYLNQTRRNHFLKQKELQEKLKQASGLPNLKFRAARPEETTVSTAAAAAPYKPPKLVPAGTARIRRANSCSQMGKLNTVVAKLERLCVLPEYRHSGVGEAVMLEAEKVAREVFHVSYVILHAQVQAKRFYLKLGYRVLSDTVFMDASIPHIVMVKDLTKMDALQSAHL